MNTNRIEQATEATLTDIYALHDPADMGTRLPALRQRIAEGKTSADRFWLLRSERGVEGVANLTARPEIPLFPRYRSDTPAELVTEFLHHLKVLSEARPGQLLVLDSQLVPLNAAPAEAAGWVLESTAAVYETDLSSISSSPDAWAREISRAEASESDVQELLLQLGRESWELKPDWSLIGLPDEKGDWVALGAVGLSGRPLYAGIDLIGVHPAQRGCGLGTRLHRHLLAHAAQQFQMHAGGAEGDNHAMRRIFEKNGSRLLSEQKYFRLP